MTDSLRELRALCDLLLDEIRAMESGARHTFALLARQLADTRFALEHHGGASACLRALAEHNSEFYDGLKLNVRIRLATLVEFIERAWSSPSGRALALDHVLLCMEQASKMPIER